ncbi:MAG TPA: trimethylamine methyltransferase family protein, partial [Steroidobacteraceae bacterium]|nr:trimethylamine methyltransferase family protein [Steroidobacteraceae bacterium]
MQHTARRRVRRVTAQQTPSDAGLHHGLTAAYEPIAAQGAQRLIDAALTLLHDSGVAFEPGSAALDILRAGGCDVAADGVVRFEPALVRDALGSTAKSAQLWDRTGTRFLTLDCHHTWFIPGMTCIKVYDLESGEQRDSNGEDLATITRVADALANIDAMCIACKNIARSDIHGEIEEFAIMAANTTKPLEYLCEHARSLEVVIDMAAAIRGSREALFEKPYFLQIITPLPLSYYSAHSDQLIQAVRAGVPISVGTLPIGGASTPITTAGSIVNSLATDFAAMVLAQLVRRGSFCIGSSDVCFMEPATGGIGNFAQTSLADMIMCQVRRRLGLPSFTGAAGYSAARRFNQDAVAELTAGMMQIFFSRPATLDYLGSLDQGLTYSLHALLLCNDLAGLLRTMWQGVAIDEESLALDLARSVGPRGNYLAQQHTVDHCREHLWPSRYFGPNLTLSNEGRPDQDLYARIDQDLRQLLATHKPPPLGPELAQRLRSIRERF